MSIKPCCTAIRSIRATQGPCTYINPTPKKIRSIQVKVFLSSVPDAPVASICICLTSFVLKKRCLSISGSVSAFSAGNTAQTAYSYACREGLVLLSCSASWALAVCAMRQADSKGKPGGAMGAGLDGAGVPE